jgi:hypothetical protein
LVEEIPSSIISEQNVAKACRNPNGHPNGHCNDEGNRGNRGVTSEVQL